VLFVILLQEADSTLRYFTQFFQNCSIVETGMSAPASEQLRITLTQLANYA
jgi:hypothetical protein